MFDIKKAREKGINEKSIAMLQRINENNARRDGCKFHEFVNDENNLPVCKNCGYKAGTLYVMGYQDALKHMEALNK